MATEATKEFDLSKKKSLGGDMDNWELAKKMGAGKSAAKEVKNASGMHGNK